MPDEAALVAAARARISDDKDVCASYVLFHTDIDEVERAVDQVLAASCAASVILVDNSVPPLDLAHLTDERVIVIAVGGNIGYGRANNIALNASLGKCRYNLVLNTDLRFDGSVVDGLVAFMDQHPDVGLAMPRVEYPDGTLQRLCRLLPAPMDLVGRRFFASSRWAKARNREYEFHDWSYDTEAEFPFLSGCFMFLRQATLRSVGLFDDRFFLYAEDLDLSRRINQVSRTLYLPRFTITHEYRSQSRPSFRRLRYAMVSLAKYFNKWGWFFDRERDLVNRRTVAQFSELAAKSVQR